MPEPPALVVGAEDSAHRVLAHHIAELPVEQHPLRVHHAIVRVEIPEPLAHRGHGLAPAFEIELEHGDLAREEPSRVPAPLEKPRLLEVRQPLIEESLAPLVVREHAHRVLVARFMDDESQIRGIVHDHHRELGAASPLDPVHIGELRPGGRPVQRIEPGERRYGALQRHAVSAAPGAGVAPLIEHPHHDVAVASFLVDVIRVEREGEVVDLLGVEVHAFAAG